MKARTAALLDVRVLLARHGQHPGHGLYRHVARTKELRPDDEELAEIKAAPKGLGAAVKDIASAVRTMPVAMHKIGLAFLFQWYAMFIYWQFVAVSIGDTAFNADPETGGQAWEAAVSWTGLMNASLQLLHHGLGAVPDRLGPADRREEGQAVALGLAALSAGRAVADHQPVPRPASR